MVKKEIRTIADAMLEKKGEKVLALDLRAVGTAISDFFVVCNAASTTQVCAISDNVEDKMYGVLKRKPLRTQGKENGIWVILDYGDVVVHVFQSEYRNFYTLEDLWADARRTEFKDN